jgi:hypothetical protein
MGEDYNKTIQNYIEKNFGKDARYSIKGNRIAIVWEVKGSKVGVSKLIENIVSDGGVEYENCL